MTQTGEGGNREETPLADQLAGAIKGTYDGFDARFREVEYSWQAEHLDVHGTFLYPPFGSDGTPSVDLLVTWLYYRIIAFCIPKAERDRADAEYARTHDDRYPMELHDKARHLFVRARNSQKTSGEPGELLLFTLLEAVLKAPQIACKMYLKTSSNVPVHGSDSIHAMTGQSRANLRLVWGESKTYKGVRAALETICTSISTFLAEGSEGEPAPRARDIDIIKDHLNVTDPTLKTALLEYLDPYSPRSNELEEMFACLVAYEEPIYGTMTTDDNSAREDDFRNRYAEAIRETCDHFARHLRESGLARWRVHLFLLPVPSIHDFRRSFFNRLGVPSDAIGVTEDDADD